MSQRPPSEAPQGTHRVTKTELVWPGKYDEHGNLREVPRVSLPFQVVETINESRATREAKHERTLSLFDVYEGTEGDTVDEGWRNKLIWGENLLAMGSLLERFAGQVDLIYIDPPFATGADFSYTAQVGEDDAEVTKEQSIIEEKAYRDTWGRGVASYLQMMAERLELMRDLLSVSGSIFVHCDWHVSHILRLILESVFGQDQFINEIIWKRKGGSANPQNRLGVVTDTVLWFAASPQATVNPLFSKDDPDTQRYIKERFNNVDEQGRQYMKSPIVSPNPRPNLTYDYKGYTPPRNGWSISRDVMERWDKEGRLYFPPRGSGDRIYRKIYLDEYVGQPIQNLWTDVFVINPVANERLNYPTQKPEALLDRIIRLASRQGDLVADFFCGSGTTPVVAERLGRRWIGCDLSRWAVHTTRKRLLGIEATRPFEVLNLGRYERKYWQAATFRTSRQADEQLATFQYLAFILRLYGAEPLAGMQHIHGKKGRALVHIGAVDAPVTIGEIGDCVEECVAIGQSEVHILAWEWEMGLANPMVQEARRRGVKLLLLNIPREVMEQQAVERGDVHFFEVAHLEVEIATSRKREATAKLTDFSFPYADLIPEEVRDKIKRWSDFVDYWAVDWDFQNDTFMNGWVTYRTRKDRTLPLQSDPHTYDATGTHQVMVKVVDIFGNDTSQVFEVEVK